MRRVVLAMTASVLGAISGGAMGQATVNPGTAAAKPAAEQAPWRALNRTDAQWQRAGWWNEAVFYQIFVRSFQDASSGPLAGDGIGDFRGLIERLDYLNDARPAEGKPTSPASLGVTALWLMPIHPSPSYHGYDVADYYGVNPQFGTKEDFRAFMRECERRGIRVILDLVLNHCSSEHPWFVEASRGPASPKRDWFIWADTVPQWRGPWNQAVWWRTGDRPGAGFKPPEPGETGKGPYFYGIFYQTMPDLNYRNEEVSVAVLDAVRHWLKEEGVHGYRLDAIRHLVEEGNIQENTAGTHEWLKRFFREYKAARPDAFTIGEVWSNVAQAASYVGDELDTSFEFDLSYAMIDAARDGKAERFVKAQRAALEHYPSNQYGRFLSNHDQTRVMTSLKGDAGAMRVASAMLLLGPGVPFIYYGEELGVLGDKPDENLRTPMQWSAAPAAGFTAGKPWREPQPGWRSQNVEAQSAAPGSLLSWYKTLIRARRSSPALMWGSTTVLDASRPEVVAFLRHADAGAGGKADSPAESVLVLINLGRQAVEEYEIAAAGSPLRGELGAREVLSAAWPVRGATAGPGGEVKGWKPLDRLEARGVYVLRLGN